MNNGVLGFCSKQILQCNKSYLHFKLVIITYDSQVARRSTDIIGTFQWIKDAIELHENLNKIFIHTQISI